MIKSYWKYVKTNFEKKKLNKTVNIDISVKQQ